MAALSPPDAPPQDDRLALLKHYGADAMSFLALEQWVQWWHDSAAPPGVGADIAFVDTGRAWLAVGRPLAHPRVQPWVATHFSADARAANRRPAFVAVDALDPFTGFRRLRIGSQPIHVTSQWPATLDASAGLRAQLRRAVRKGVRARVVRAKELEKESPVRCAVERLRTRWLASRRMPPMGFLTSVEPFHAPDEHVYVVAERDGHVVEFLSAVPVYRSGGWLIEDVLRDPRAPNGTSELVLDCAMRQVLSGWVTLGLTPLAGPVAWPLMAARRVMGAYYDFDGLRLFRERLRPTRWDPVWLVWDRGCAGLRLRDLLEAFGGGSITGFGARSVVRRLRR